MSNIHQLDAYVDSAGSRAFAWKSLNCMLYAADWVVVATGLDPASAWRGRFETELQARMTILREGGLKAVAAREMAALGFALTTDPLPGDVAVVDVPVRMTSAGPLIRPVAAIRLGRLWSVKSAFGLVARDFPLQLAWSLTA